MLSCSRFTLDQEASACAAGPILHSTAEILLRMIPASATLLGRALSFREKPAPPWSPCTAPACLQPLEQEIPRTASRQGCSLRLKYQSGIYILLFSGVPVPLHATYRSVSCKGCISSPLKPVGAAKQMQPWCECSTGSCTTASLPNV